MTSQRSEALELTALVGGGVNYGEADRVVHLLTARGRMSAFAHGARKSKRRFAGALEPFVTIRATLEPRRNSRESTATMRSAVVASPRLALREDLSKIALASYTVELALAVAPEEADSAELYALTEGMLDGMLEQPATTLKRRTFELRLIDVLGYRPQLEACVRCGEATGPTYLDLSQGGVLCAAHRGAATEIGPRTLEWLIRLLEAGEDGPEHAGLGVEWAETAARKLATPCARFFSGLLARPLGSRSLLDDLGI